MPLLTDLSVAWRLMSHEFELTETGGVEEKRKLRDQNPCALGIIVNTLHRLFLLPGRGL